MGRKQPPVQQPPPVQKLRLHYAKRGVARFTSHRDFARALERALRRAEVPMAYSSGFTPHPRISYANASPTGAASEAEYLELGLSQVCNPHKVKSALNDVLPTGFEVIAIAEGRRESLTDLLQASDWEMQLPGVAPEELQGAASQLLSAEKFVVERMTKNGLRSFDVRAALLHLVAEGDTLEFRVVHQTPLVRPQEVRTALHTIAPGIPDTPPGLRRLRQGPLSAGEILDPLA